MKAETMRAGKAAVEKVAAVRVVAAQTTQVATWTNRAEEIAEGTAPAAATRIMQAVTQVAMPAVIPAGAVARAVKVAALQTETMAAQALVVIPGLREEEKTAVARTGGTREEEKQTALIMETTGATQVPAEVSSRVSTPQT